MKQALEDKKPDFTLSGEEVEILEEMKEKMPEYKNKTLDEIAHAEIKKALTEILEEVKKKQKR